jgi:hypothetical protein
MDKGELLTLLKLAVVSGGAAAAQSPVTEIMTHYFKTPVWGVPVTVIGAAGAGAVMSLFFGDPIARRRDLYGQTIAATMFGCAVAVLAADGMGWQWAHNNMPMFALMSAAMIRWFLPTTIERIKALIKEFRFPSIKKTGGDK